jgi:hypothetical protein
MDRKGVQDGMKVQSADGKSLGKVVSCGDASFLIEKGFFFPKDYTAGYESVAQIDGDQVWLAVSAEALMAGPSAPVAGVASPRPAEAGALQSGRVAVPIQEEEVEIQERPVVREEVPVSKTPRQGELRADADAGPTKGEPDDA